jgi:phosphate transport system substrate-binding protein
MAKCKCINFECELVGQEVEVESGSMQSEPKCKECSEPLVCNGNGGSAKWIGIAVGLFLLLGGGYFAIKSMINGNDGGSSMEEQYYQLNITTDPSDATIKVDSKPFTSGSKLKEGNYKIVVSKDGYNPITKNIVLDSKQSFDITLSPSPTTTPNPTSTPVPSPTTNNKTIMKICGSNLVNHEIMPTLAKMFLKEIGYKDVSKELTDNDHKILIVGMRGSKKESIEILSDGSRKGYDDLLTKNCDLAISYGDIDRNIAKSFDFDIKTEAYEDPFLMDAMAIVVNRNNPIESLTTHQIRDIFSGKIKNWSSITNNQKNADIKLYAMGKSSGIYHEFIKDLTSDSGNFSIASHKEFIKHEELEAEVALNPNAIGFISNEHVTDNVKVVPLKEGNDLIPPNSATIISGEYAFFDELYLYTSPTSKPLSIKFKEYLNTNEAQEWISQNTKLIAIEIITKEEMRDEEIEKRRRLQNSLIPQEYRDYMRNLVKTPINFHFNTGKSNLDYDTTKHITQLKYLLSHQDYSNATIVLIGFSDSNGGDTDAQRTLSLRRADEVKRHIAQQNISNSMQSKGFGANIHLLYEPYADNEHERKIDRRVEVWLRVNR